MRQINRIVILDHHRDVGYLRARRTAGGVLVPVETLDNALNKEGM